jgi:hypothetical protein
MNELMARAIAHMADIKHRTDKATRDLKECVRVNEGNAKGLLWSLKSRQNEKPEDFFWTLHDTMQRFLFTLAMVKLEEVLREIDQDKIDCEIKRLAESK